MAVHDQRYVTPEEYLALERAAERKSEYRDGEIIGMTGATRRHSLITVNVSSELNRQLKGRPCEVHVNDLRVLIAARRLYTYPDVIVVCGEPALADRYRDTLTNPTLLVEVLSQLPPVKVYPAVQAGEVALPELAVLTATGAEACVVHCSAVASDCTK